MASPFSPRLIDVVEFEQIIGRIIGHGDRQFSAFDLAGRPLGVFSERAAAESAVRNAGAETHGGAD